MENQTNAQVNVQIDIEFGREEIRNKLKLSLDNAEVTSLSSDIEQGVCIKLSEFAYQMNAQECRTSTSPLHACIYDSMAHALCIILCMYNARSIELHTLHLNRVVVLLNYIPCT